MSVDFSRRSAYRSTGIAHEFQNWRAADGRGRGGHLAPRDLPCLDNPIIAEHLEAIRDLCREFGVARLEVFGSVCTPDFDPERSDVDFIVEYPPDYEFGPWLTRYFALEEALATLLGRKVDLVMTKATENKWFRREANKTRTAIYDTSKVAEVA